MLYLKIILFSLLRMAVEIFPAGGSVAHSALLQWLLPPGDAGLAYAIAAQAGMVLGLLLFFAKDLKQMVLESPALLQYPFAKNKYTFFSGCQYALTLSLLMTACIAAGAVHYMLREAGGALSAFIPATGFGWLFMAFLLFKSRRDTDSGRSAYEMNHQDSFVIGCLQGLSVMPGFSRTGLGVVLGMKLGIQGKEAMRFSYLLTIPYFIATLWMKTQQGVSIYDAIQPAMFVAFITSLLATLVGLRLIEKIIAAKKYFLFSFYCLGAGVSMAGYFFLRRFF